MKVNMGLTPEKLPVKVGQAPVIQNLGPGDVYLDYASNVSSDTGIKIGPGVAFEFANDLTKEIHGVATSADTDVRILVVG